MGFARLAMAAAGMLGLVVLGALARAATVTETYVFNIGPFTGTAAVPYNNWAGSFTVSFDPTTTGPGTITAFSSNISAFNNLTNPALNAPGWTYMTTTSLGTEPGQYVLVVGNYCIGGGTNCTDQTGSGTVANSSFIQVDLGPSNAPLSVAPTIVAAEYATGTGTVPANPHFSASVNNPQTTVAIPEPGSAGLLVAGILLLGFVRQSRAASASATREAAVAA